jgi:hypothetical protein
MKPGLLSDLFTPKLPVNRKLTPILAGRTIAAVQQDGPLATITFKNGSQMHVKTGAPVPAAPVPKGALKTVRQGGTAFKLIFDDGTRLDITLTEATSSVLLRNAGGDLEYAD